MSFNLTRRAVVGGLASSVALPAFAQNLPLPSSPVTLNFVDVAGNLALTQKAIEAYRDKNPKLVAKINFTKAPAPELPGKIKAQQDANRVDIDGVLTGIDALSAGVDQIGCSARAASRQRGTQISDHSPNSAVLVTPYSGSRVSNRNRLRV